MGVPPLEASSSVCVNSPMLSNPKDYNCIHLKQRQNLDYFKTKFLCTLPLFWPFSHKFEIQCQILAHDTKIDILKNQ